MSPSKARVSFSGIYIVVEIRHNHIKISLVPIAFTDLAHQWVQQPTIPTLNHTRCCSRRITCRLGRRSSCEAAGDWTQCEVVVSGINGGVSKHAFRSAG